MKYTDHQEYVNLIIIKIWKVIITACTTYQTYKVTVIREYDEIILDGNYITTQWNIVLGNIVKNFIYTTHNQFSMTRNITSRNTVIGK